MAVGTLACRLLFRPGSWGESQHLALVVLDFWGSPLSPKRGAIIVVIDFWSSPLPRISKRARKRGAHAHEIPRAPRKMPGGVAHKRP